MRLIPFIFKVCVAARNLARDANFEQASIYCVNNNLECQPELADLQEALKDGGDLMYTELV